MGRKLGVMLGLLALAGAACKASVTNSAPQVQTSTVHVIEHATTDVVIDTGAKGDTTGDLLTWHNVVFDQNDSAKAGTDQGDCIRIDVKGGTWECWWTTFLDGGQITVEGPFYDAKDSTLAITGGTGSYAHATGEMDLQSRNGGKEYDFIFHLQTT